MEKKVYNIKRYLRRKENILPNKILSNKLHKLFLKIK
jgi:hypothetical protein